MKNMFRDHKTLQTIQVGTLNNNCVLYMAQLMCFVFQNNRYLMMYLRF